MLCETCIELLKALTTLVDFLGGVSLQCFFKQKSQSFTQFLLYSNVYNKCGDMNPRIRPFYLSNLVIGMLVDLKYI